MNPLLELQDLGQAVWFDYIRRSMLTGGELKKLMAEDGLRGITSNPAIFEKAIVGSTDYTDAILELSKNKALDTKGFYEALAIKDIQDAADILRPVYDKTDAQDGYVSLEVSPFLARDTQGTLAEARRLWKTVNRPNVMIKVPGTEEGVPAIKELTAEGVNVNITLLFSMDYYKKSADAYLEGLEARVEKGLPINHIASVASFFVSRIDSLVDAQIGARMKDADSETRALLGQLEGKVAIANAKVTYQDFKKRYAEPRFLALAKKGARPQRLLWASTGTKNPKYSDVLYVETLIGDQTVNTMPPATLDAFRDHGKAALTVETQIDEAVKVMATLEKVGISFKDVTDRLLEDGIKIFADAFQKLSDAIEGKRKDLTELGQADALSILASGAQGNEALAIIKELDAWTAGHKVHSLWARDASLWTKNSEPEWMGWLSVSETMSDEAPRLMDFAQEIRQAGFKHIAVLGMGGSSLCPAVLAQTFGQIKGFPRLHVLDSTDPDQIVQFESELDVKKTLFVVASKSGGTLEPNLFADYFLGKAPAENFIAITDPGSQLENGAKEKKFRRVFYGVSSIGGRYSALSNFGLVPAALMGVDVVAFLDKANEMVHACSHSVLPRENPGVLLGVMLGVLAKFGKNKITFVLSPKIKTLGAWLEQLLAESTGKSGKGLIPVDGEHLGTPESYGRDRVFVYVHLADEKDAKESKALDALEAANYPVIRLEMPDVMHLGAEFFRWEIATAVAGSVLGINPFDQPDVEASKDETRRLMGEFAKTGKMEQSQAAIVVSAPSLKATLKSHFDAIKPDDYFATLAFISMNSEHEQVLQSIRELVRTHKKVATCLGFGPRFLHSTGQIYKGGPNTGVFLQITGENSKDLPIPGQNYTFATVIAAQAQGDFKVLAERHRRVLRVHLGKDVAEGLKILITAVKEALAS